MYQRKYNNIIAHKEKEMSERKHLKHQRSEIPHAHFGRVVELM
jgi:hypothetical protein